MSKDTDTMTKADWALAIVRVAVEKEEAARLRYDKATEQRRVAMKHAYELGASSDDISAAYTYGRLKAVDGQRVQRDEEEAAS